MTAYDDLDTPLAMRTDAARARAHLPAPTALPTYADAYAVWPTDLPKPEVSVSDAARRLAAVLGLSLD